MAEALPLLTQMIEKGHYVAIEKGKLVIRPSSEKPVTKGWLDAKGEQLVVEILKNTSYQGFKYQGHHVGLNEVRPGVKDGGLTLTFENLITHVEPYVIFNVNVCRTKNSINGKAGELLPKGKFTVGKRHKFYKFWGDLGLPLPRRKSEFHTKLSSLKTLYFVFHTAHSNGGNPKIDKQSIKPLSITHKEILEAFEHNVKFCSGPNYSTKPWEKKRYSSDQDISF